jgi:hypothetical protein
MKLENFTPVTPGWLVEVDGWDKPLVGWVNVEGRPTPVPVYALSRLSGGGLAVVEPHQTWVVFQAGD